MILSVVMPVYNEAATVEQSVRAVSNVDIDVVKEIILVDDGSKDGTDRVLEKIKNQYANVKVALHPVNQGKGAALRTGFQMATGDLVVVQDADLEYSPSDYEKLLEPILKGYADVVFGSRFMGGGAHRVLYFWHYVGNKIITILSNMMTNLNLTDVEVGYKIFRREILQSINLKENRFGFEIEITAKVARQKCRIYEVPISYFGRDYSQGKKIGWRDGVWALWCILKYRFVD